MKYVTLFLGDKAIIKQSIVFFGTELIKAENNKLGNFIHLKRAVLKKPKES